MKLSPGRCRVISNAISAISAISSISAMLFPVFKICIAPPLLLTLRLCVVDCAPRKGFCLALLTLFDPFARLLVHGEYF